MYQLCVYIFLFSFLSKKEATSAYISKYWIRKRYKVREPQKILLFMIIDFSLDQGEINTYSCGFKSQKTLHKNGTTAPPKR